jgi:hypothetical protein
LAIELLDRLYNRFAFGAARARRQKSPKSSLVIRTLINVRDAKFWLPEEGVVRALEDLALLGDRPHDSFKRRAFVHIAKCAALDLFDHARDATPNGPKILEALLP